jgi:hypothetical protein
MPQGSVFDRLVADLSLEERRDLLERLDRSVIVSDEPLYDKIFAERAGAPSHIRNLSELGLLKRILLYLRRFFTGRDIDSLLVEDELKALARNVEAACPGIVDYRRGMLTSLLHEELKKLRDAARFFYDVLDRSFDRDKAEFFAFLGSVELPETHGRLLAETNPFAWAEAHPDAPESEVRQAVTSAYDEIFMAMPEERRKAMYQDLRCLLFLKRLSGFLFERLLSTFKPGAGPAEGPAASFTEAADLLVELGDILFSLSRPPSISLMESLFCFAEQETLENPESDAEALIAADLGAAETAVARIRTFNRRVPFVDIVRLATEDPAHQPRELAAGEDWLVVYRGFWRSRIEAQLDELRSNRRYRRLAEEVAAFVGDAEPASFAHISREEGPGCPPIRQDLPLAFMDAFTRGSLAKEFNRPLKIVLVDGEFYRKENRIEFTDAYDLLGNTAETIAALDARLGPDGEIGLAWSRAKLEIAPVVIKRRKIQSIARSAEDEAERMIRNFAGALSTLVRVIRGILKGEAGGRYDSLANLSSLDGRANREFLRSLAAAKDRSEMALALLTELSGLDLPKAEE